MVVQYITVDYGTFDRGLEMLYVLNNHHYPQFIIYMTFNHNENTIVINVLGNRTYHR